MSVQLAPLTRPQQAFGGHDNTQKIERFYFTLTPSGNYAGAPGDLMDFTSVTGGADGIKSGAAPILVFIESAKVGGASGYSYSYIPTAAPTQANGTFQVLQCGGAASPMADIGAGAYPAGVTGDSIIGFADFPRV